MQYTHQHILTLRDLVDLADDLHTHLFTLSQQFLGSLALHAQILHADFATQLEQLSLPRNLLIALLSCICIRLSWSATSVSFMNREPNS
jgi:hypothetical protein